MARSSEFRLIEGSLPAAGHDLEYSLLMPEAEASAQTGLPLLVLLHEGLGCIAMWREFPRQLMHRTGCPVLVYSRAGYGNSSPCALPRPLDYMQQEAKQVLPEVFAQLSDSLAHRRRILVGHSDGASIAALYAALQQDEQLDGCVLIAPHFFTESVALEAIADASVAYHDGDLRQRLSRYHSDVDVAFHGWNDAWLDPGFKRWDIRPYLGAIKSPLLLVQGINDRYGTLAQLEVAEQLAGAETEKRLLPDCDHSPHVEKPAELLLAVTEFIKRCTRAAPAT